MTTAFEDFQTTLKSLRELAGLLGAPALGGNRARSKEAIQLNGMHVVAFACLEDFIRRRVLESAKKISDLGVRFADLPDHLRLFLLTETFAGIGFALDRTETSQKANLLQHEGMLFSITSDFQAKYEPSEYIFGRSSSNISLAQIKALLDAFGMDGGLNNLSHITVSVALTHLGAPDAIYSRLSKNRHRAAHSFKDEYEISQFVSDLTGGIILFAFCFDTCISQACSNIILNLEKGFVHKNFSASDINIKKAVFDTSRKSWDIFRNGKKVKTLKKAGFAQFFEDSKLSCAQSGDSLLVMGVKDPTTWVQPF